MKTTALSLLALSGGIFLAIQAGYNTKLGVLTKTPLLAVISTSTVSAIISTILFFLVHKESMPISSLSKIPVHLWLVGGLFSTLGIAIYFFTIPQLGISKMISFGLCGQLLFSLIAGKYGWFNLPSSPLTLKEILGSTAIITGIFLINYK